MAKNPFSVTPAEMQRLRQTYKGKTTKPVNIDRYKVDAKPRAKPQPKLKVAPMPSIGSAAQSVLGALRNAPQGLADLAVALPTAAYDYIRTSTPSSVAGDIKSGVTSAVEAIGENPGEAFADLVAGGAKGTGEMLREASLARDAGDEERAAQIESLAVPMLLGAVIPGGRAARGAGKVARAEERALLKKEAALAAKAEKSLAVPGKQKASAPAEKPTGGKSLAAKSAGEKALAAKPTKKAAAPAAAPNPTKVIAEEYSPEIARRVRDVVDADAGLEQWREAAANLQGTQSNRPYQPENDPAFRDFDLGTYGMRKTIDQPRLFDLDVERQRWSPEQERNMLGFQAIVGRPIMTGMADRTPSGTTITRIGPTELDIPIKEHGGQDYMRDTRIRGASLRRAWLPTL